MIEQEYLFNKLGFWTVTTEITVDLIRSRTCDLLGFSHSFTPSLDMLRLISIPVTNIVSTTDLFLEKKNAIEKSFSGWRASWDVNINWYNSINTSDNGITVVIITTPISTGAHRKDISWGWHLIVNSSQCWSHLICQSTSNNHQIRLTWRCAENNAKSIHIISWCSEVHHLDSTTSETESHWPKGRCSDIILNIVQLASQIFDLVIE